MKKALVEKVVEEAKSGKSDLVVSDEKDTFTVESGDLDGLEVAEDHLRVEMQDGRTTIYVEFEEIHKLIVNKDRGRAGFGLSG